MEETGTVEGIGSAVEKIQAMATRAADVQVVSVACDDGAGGVLPVSVGLTRDNDGGITTNSLLDEMRAGAAFAQGQRLAKAAGPDRRQGTAQHQALSSFIAHANRFKAENSAVWANPTSRELVSVLDYHPAGDKSPARWGKHRGVYRCPLSEAWQAWGGGREIKLSQDGFAELLDKRDRELGAGKFPDGRVAPDPAALVTLAANLEVYSNATARRERDPNTGRVKISYSEEKGVTGSLTPPSAFLIHVPIFEDSAPGYLEVRLRVAVDEGAATFLVQIHAAAEVLRDAFDGLCHTVQQETALPVFVGTPET